MPSFYTHQMPRHPLTPPEHYGPYSNATGTYYPTPSQYDFNANEGRYNMDGHDKYGMSNQDPFARDVLSDQARPAVTGFSTALGRRDNGYGSIGAPVLPPIRIPDNTMDNHVGRRQSILSSHAQAQVPPKEEKVAGGVAAHLDYEMEQMIDFVAEMAQGMYDLLASRLCLADIDVSRSIQPSSSVSSAFRKYVSQILTSTRLPCSTILLALHYLASRMTMLSVRGVYTSSNGHLYHMLTTSLMLASKFLDDNTFQNRSWAEVSHIPVADLNQHEMEWLVDIKWKLHIDVADPQGFSAWLGQWERWQTKKVVMSMEALKLTPADTTLRLPQSAHKYAPPTPVYTPSYSEPMFNMPAKDHSPPHWSQWPSQRTISPPSTNHSGSNTPDWFSKNPPPGFGQQLPPYSTRQLPSHLTMLPSSYYGSYSQQQYPTSWCGHGIGCSCTYYPMHNDRYPITHGYGVQPVAG